MWLFAGGMQRSASTLQYQMASSIVEHCGMGHRVTWSNLEDHEQVLAKHEGAAILVFKSHVLTPPIRKVVARGDGRCIYIYRDLRDVIASMIEKFGRSDTVGEAEATARSLMDTHAAWTSLNDIYISRYEDVIADMKSEISGIADYLGASVDSSFVARLAADLAPERQARRIAEAANSGDMVRVNDSTTYHPTTLLHENHILDGRAGRYRDTLSPELIKAIEGQAAGWLKEHGYPVGA